MRGSILRWTLAIFTLVLLPGGIAAHDIPTDLTARIFVKPEGQRLRVLMRIPLGAVRDVQFPEQEHGFLDFEKARPQLGDLAMLWMGEPLALYEDGERLQKPKVAATQLAFASDGAFSSYETALARVMDEKPGNEAKVVWYQLWFDALFEYPIRSEASSFSIRPGTERLAARVTTVLRFLPPGGTERAYQLHMEGPEGDTGVLPLDPRWHQAAFRFVLLGFHHILDGMDHLLFLFCLVIPLRRFRPLLLVITAFTVAHSITLIASAYGYAPDALWFPPLIETLIALSIVYMALENIAGATAGTALNPDGKQMAEVWRTRWAVTFGFGLIHGFGFSFLLRDSLQFAGEHLVTSLLAFNVGVELGQIFVLAVAVPALYLLFRYVVAERIGAIILSAVIAHTGWHWMAERFETLGQYGIGLGAIAGAPGAALACLLCTGIVMAVWWLRPWRVKAT